MKPSRTVELLLDIDEGPAVVFLGIATVVVAFFAGLFLITQGVGESWAEICTAQGGQYEDAVTYNEEGDKTGATETCTPAEER